MVEVLSNGNDKAKATNYDLTSTLSQYLDRHLAFPLLQFLEGQNEREQVYDPETVMQAKFELISRTNMIDFAVDIFKTLHQTESAPQDLMERRGEVVLVLRGLQEVCSPFLDIFEDETQVNDLQEKKLFNMQNLEESFGITDETLEYLYDYSKFQYDCGNYSATSEYLAVYRLLQTKNPEREFAALWGKFAADILMEYWDSALETMNQLKDAIEQQSKSNAMNPLQSLQQRTWLIHWSLFVFYNHPNGKNLIIDMLFQEKYLNTIQTSCSHILRYLTMAVITNKRRRNVLKDLVRVIQQEQYTYHDPITEFIECLYVSFDFEAAQNMLQKCEDTIRNDFFLVDSLDEFIEDARLMIFEIYCRIHKCIDIDMLAGKLNMDRESAERWIVNLIRSARLDAKIDSQANQVLMSINVPSVHEQVVESTKGLIVRSSSLVQSLNRGIAGGEGGYKGYWRGGGGGRDRR